MSLLLISLKGDSVFDVYKLQVKKRNCCTARLCGSRVVGTNLGQLQSNLRDYQIHPGYDPKLGQISAPDWQQTVVLCCGNGRDSGAGP